MSQSAPVSLQRRLLLVALGGVVVVLGVGGWGLSSAFEAAVERGFDERIKTVLQTLIAEAETDPEGQLVLSRPLGDPRFDQIYSGSYWQIANAEGVLLRSRSLWDQEIPFSVGAPDSSPMFRYWQNETGQNIRLAERDLILPGRTDVLHFIVAGRTDDIEQELRQFDGMLLLGMLGLVVALGVTMAAQMRIGLQPLRAMLKDLAAVWEGREQRVNERLPEELKPLAVSINQLLSHENRQVSRVRDQAAELAHAIKTPLAVLRADVESLESSLAESMRERLDLIDGLVRRNLARANAGRQVTLSGLLTPVKPVVEAMHLLMSRVHPDSHREVALHVPDSLRIRLEQEDLEEILGNLLDNAWNWSRLRIRMNADLESETCRLTVEDDGPGLAPEDRQRVIERRVRLDERVPGQGLGLSIVRDILAPIGGTIELGDSPLGGLAVTLVLPAAPMPSPVGDLPGMRGHSKQRIKS